MRVTVELSGEAVALAVAELEGAASALGGRVPAGAETPSAARTVDVEVPDRGAADALAGRLALARRCVAFQGPVDVVLGWWQERARSGQSAAIRWLGHGRRSGGSDPLIVELARLWIAAGGRIELEDPQVRFWLRKQGEARPEIGEEVGSVHRRELLSRRLSRLPFRRPVGLDPRLARACVNLAQIRPGDRVVDPFVGTGALLSEAALLGARVTGVDVEDTMVRGAARNFEHLGVTAERWIVDDAESAARGVAEGVRFDALLSDIPYGRSSGTRGEGIEPLLRRALPRWAELLSEGARVVLVSATEIAPLGDRWRRIRALRIRQHRSLTRIFSVYERA